MTSKIVKMGKEGKKTKAEVRSLIRQKLEMDKWLGDRSQKCKKELVVKALREGCDITTSAALAKVSREQVYQWFKADSMFKTDAIFSREMAVRELVEICKSDTTTAWKLLKNAARGRYTDDAGGDTGTNVVINISTPRPEHKIIDAKVIDEKEEEEEEI